MPSEGIVSMRNGKKRKARNMIQRWSSNDLQLAKESLGIEVGKMAGLSAFEDDDIVVKKKN